MKKPLPEIAGYRTLARFEGLSTKRKRRARRLYLRLVSRPLASGGDDMLEECVRRVQRAGLFNSGYANVQSTLIRAARKRVYPNRYDTGASLLESHT